MRRFLIIPFLIFFSGATGSGAAGSGAAGSGAAGSGAAGSGAAGSGAAGSALVPVAPEPVAPQAPPNAIVGEPAEIAPRARSKTRLQLEKISAEAETSPYRRVTSPMALHLNYSMIDLIVPGKIGVGFNWTDADLQTQYELQYLTASKSAGFGVADLGEIRENRVSFLVRNFDAAENFNWYYGLSYIELNARLGSDILNQAYPANPVGSIDIINVQALALDIGLGHRWYLAHDIVLSFDWIGLSQPVTTLKKNAPFLEANTTSSGREDVQEFLDIIGKFPRIYTVKASLGYSF